MTINPFYRFESIQRNAGFDPELSVQSNLLNSFFNEYSDGDFIGQKYFIAVNDYKSKIATLNLPINGGQLSLIKPKPYPAITGVQTLVFKVQSNQLAATEQSQYLEITLDLNNGIITSDSYVFSGSISKDSDYDSPLLEIEKEIRKTLEVYSQNGSAFFNPYYSFNRNTQLATSGLIRAKNWKLIDETVNRFPVPTNPYRANDWILIDAFLPEDNYILAQFGKVVNVAFDATKTISDLTSLANGLDFPSGFALSITDNTSDKIEITLSGSDSGFKLIGFFDTIWTWQRFYTNVTPVSVPFISVGSFTGQWPFEPNTGRFYQTLWFDVEDLIFDSESDSEGEYLQPIKTGDLLQFNIIPELSNITGIESCQIGIFDCDGNFLQEIGGAFLPSCFSRTFNILLSSVDVTNLLDSLDDVIISGYDSNGDFILTNTVPFASLDQTNATDYAQSIIDFINPLGELDATFTIDGGAINFQFTLTDLSLAIVYLEYSVGVFAQNSTETRCVFATQLQASVTIPSLPNGKYYFGLYSQTGYISEIYSFSNGLILNNSEKFSQILEIGSPETAIIEGFEYYNNWIQRIRANINGAGQTYSIEESIYRNSDGTFQKPQNSTDENISLHTDYLDLSTQRAMTSATRHPIFVLNGQNLSVQGDLEVATVQDFTTNQSFRKLQQMKFSAKIQGYQPANNACIG